MSEPNELLNMKPPPEAWEEAAAFFKGEAEGSRNGNAPEQYTQILTNDSSYEFISVNNQIFSILRPLNAEGNSKIFYVIDRDSVTFSLARIPNFREVSFGIPKKVTEGMQIEQASGLVTHHQTGLVYVGIYGGDIETHVTTSSDMSEYRYLNIPISIMPYLGRTLRHHLADAEQPLIDPQRIDYATQLAYQVHCAHQGYLTNGKPFAALDIGLGNVCVNEAGQIKLIDFGDSEYKPEELFDPRKNAGGGTLGYRPTYKLQKKMTKGELDNFALKRCLTFADNCQMVNGSRQDATEKNTNPKLLPDDFIKAHPILAQLLSSPPYTVEEAEQALNDESRQRHDSSITPLYISSAIAIANSDISDEVINEIKENHELQQGIVTLQFAGLLNDENYQKLSSNPNLRTLIQKLAPSLHTISRSELNKAISEGLSDNYTSLKDLITSPQNIQLHKHLIINRMANIKGESKDVVDVKPYQEILDKLDANSVIKLKEIDDDTVLSEAFRLLEQYQDNQELCATVCEVLHWLYKTQVSSVELGSWEATFKQYPRLAEHLVILRLSECLNMGRINQGYSIQASSHAKSMRLEETMEISAILPQLNPERLEFAFTQRIENPVYYQRILEICKKGPEKKAKLLKYQDRLLTLKSPFIYDLALRHLTKCTQTESDARTFLDALEYLDSLNVNDDSKAQLAKKLIKTKNIKTYCDALSVLKACGQQTDFNWDSLNIILNSKERAEKIGQFSKLVNLLPPQIFRQLVRIDDNTAFNPTLYLRTSHHLSRPKTLRFFKLELKAHKEVYGKNPALHSLKLQQALNPIETSLFNKGPFKLIDILNGPCTGNMVKILDALKVETVVTPLIFMNVAKGQLTDEEFKTYFPADVQLAIIANEVNSERYEGKTYLGMGTPDGITAIKAILASEATDEVKLSNIHKITDKKGTSSTRLPIVQQLYGLIKNVTNDATPDNTSALNASYQ